ncbi:hypothetical protein PC129_g1016 [Phytophthora cactorum]|uniref:Ankyrin repeat-containing domain n=2 Tax=Phytophthora TaxID=4783 RepID=A0A329SLA9_9STRA|nr:hypothetical protein Pcac1_g19124 [Phytophthora cactorum]KAG2839938.1 hypothetical protein PC112_g3919 [Phytophthora cactorum]KAG2841574.1 hypothetical protein PC111_g3038 [Phytophthora cactorum]KAG2867605.1 hypothetical protein PC113_g1795 [Phytophthora cactorum]KAG2923691.1 hypothetical protein PC114_g4725 [Phytophthora cactorum]
MAMQEGALEAMKELYARYHGCVDSDTISAVCEMADLRVLKWLYAYEPDLLLKKFEWSEKQIFIHASMKGHADVVRWLVKLFPKRVRELVYAAKGGHLNLVKWLMKHTPWDETSLRTAFEYALVEGYLDTVQFLYLENSANRSAMHVVAPRNLGFLGNFEMAKWLHRIDCQFDNQFAEGAVSGGHLEIVKWLHINHPTSLTSVFFSTSFNAMDTAAEKGHLEVVKFLHINRREGCTTRAMNRAAANGHLEVVQWLHTNRSEGCTAAANDLAAMNGHLNVLEWLNSKCGKGCTQRGTSNALNSECLDIAKCPVGHRGHQYPDEKINIIVRRGDLDMLVWLHDNDKRMWSKEAMNTAALYGHLNIVKFLHENRREGCSTAAMNGAAAKGHLDVVKWLHVHRREGCSVSAMNDAAKEGHLNVVKWLHVHRSEGCTALAMNGAAKNGHIQVMKFLAENFPLNWRNTAMVNAVEHGQFEAVKWLHLQLHQPFSMDIAYRAARHDRIGVLEFIRLNAKHCITSTVFHTGCGNKHLEVAKWYEDHYGNPRKRKHTTLH